MQVGGLTEERPDPSVPPSSALAWRVGQGIRRGGKHSEPTAFDDCVTGRGPCDPDSVVSSAAAWAKKEILAYTR